MCTFDGCEKPAHPKAGYGLCGQHYGQRRSAKGMQLKPHRVARYPAGATCSFDGCATRPRSDGLCWTHAKQKKAGLALSKLKPRVVGRTGCAVPGCVGEHNAHGWCLNHFTIWNTHGLDPIEYERMYAAQGGVCLICSKACVSRRRLSVDHCHDTGKIRGLLCAKCNRAIGLLGDDAVLVFKAYSYLVGHKPQRRIA